MADFFCVVVVLFFAVVLSFDVSEDFTIFLLRLDRLWRGEDDSPSSNFFGSLESSSVLSGLEESLVELSALSEFVAVSRDGLVFGKTRISTWGENSLWSDEVEAFVGTGLSVLIIRSLLGIDLSNDELSTYFPKTKEM